MFRPVASRRLSRRASLLAASGAALLALGAVPDGADARRFDVPARGAAPPSTDGAPDSMTSVVLENGLRVIVVPNHSVPLATAKLVVRTGAMTQTADDQGVPHLFEHMLFKGYRGASERSFASEAAELQAGYNGTTSEEMVTYYLTMPSEGTESAIRLLAGLVRDARFTEEDLKTERFVVLGELQRENSEPRDVLRRMVAQELWREGWLQKNTIGEATALLSVTPEQLKRIYQHYYVPNNAALVVTGDVSATRVLEAARRHLGGWRRGPDPFASQPVPPLPPFTKSIATVISGDVQAVTVVMQWRGPSVRDDPASTYDADVLSDLVSEPGSTFTRHLVDGGAFQSAQLGYETLAHTGAVTFVGTTTVAQLPVALTLLSTELMLMLADDCFAPRELAAAAKRRRVARSLEQEQGVTLAHSLGYAWAITGLPYHETYADSLAARRPENLRRFMSRFLYKHPVSVGVLAPAGKDREIAAMLEQFLELMQEEK